MTDKILEENLGKFDFSVFSKVKENLLSNILRQQFKDNMASTVVNHFSMNEIVEENELDYVVAAGTGTSPKTDEK